MINVTRSLRGARGPGDLGPAPTGMEWRPNPRSPDRQSGGLSRFPKRANFFHTRGEIRTLMLSPQFLRLLCIPFHHTGVLQYSVKFPSRNRSIFLLSFPLIFLLIKFCPCPDSNRDFLLGTVVLSIRRLGRKADFSAPEPAGSYFRECLFP